MGSHLNHNHTNGSGWRTSVQVGAGARVTLDQVAAVARQAAHVHLSQEPAYCAKIEGGPATIAKLIAAGDELYGINTGYGDSCTVRIPTELVDELPAHLVTYHGCGLGAHFSPEQTRAVLLARLVSLAKGYSGVRLELLQQLEALLVHDILPLIPQEGSVGASGDLTPLSYVAAALCGQRDVLFQEVVQPAKVALTKAGLSPLSLIRKEGLALMNGTAVMTGVGALCWARAAYLSQLATRLTALSILALKGNLYHYDPLLFSLKEHPGQERVAAWLRLDLQLDESYLEDSTSGRKQDRYSLRCAPHIIGVLEDALPFFRQILETELNSANDNPLVDSERGRVYHGGMFYGGHVAFVMDSLKCLVANVADLMDRQLALLVDSNYNNGLPSNLSGATGQRAVINHGLKAVQISASAWTAEALKQTMPASVFSRSTECHNQDKVSMGTIAARDCVRVLELTEQVASTMMVATRQALALREREKGFSLRLSSDARNFLNQLKAEIPFIEEDVVLEPTLRQCVANIKKQAYELELPRPNK